MMKNIIFKSLIIIVSGIFLTSCGDYGETVYRIDNYVFADNEGTTNCLMSYEGDLLVQLDYYFSDGGDFTYDGYVAITYDGDNIRLQGYFPDGDEITYQTNTTIKVSNGLLLSYEFEDFISPSYSKIFEYTYADNRIRMIRIFRKFDGIYKANYDIEYEYQEGVLINSKGYYLFNDGTRPLSEQIIYNIENGKIADFTLYQIDDNEANPLEGEIRSFTDHGLSKIDEYEYESSSEEWEHAGSTSFSYDENAYLITEAHEDIYDDPYLFQFEYQEGKGNYEVFNFILLDYMEDLFMEYPVIKAAQTHPHRFLRGLTSIRKTKAK